MAGDGDRDVTNEPIRYWYYQPMSDMTEKQLQATYLDAVTMNDWVSIRAIGDEIREREFSLPSLSPTLSEAWRDFVDATWTRYVIRPTIRLATRMIAALAKRLTKS